MSAMRRKFFYDTEFMECGVNIELISIGVVGEDGREFYACDALAMLSNANEWVRENVIPKLPPKPSAEEMAVGGDGGPWMPRWEIRERLMEFMAPSEADPVELWAYYGAYDHVVLCSLFGSMIDLPKGMPMYTKDIRQLADHVGVDALGRCTGEHDALADARWVREQYWSLRSRIKAAGFLDELLFADL